MASEPLVSVVIPVYNAGRFLGAALDGVLTQTVRDHEVIVIDDGSRDNTAAVVAEYGRAVQYQWQENRGVSAARNAGIGLARGEYVAFLDADDVWLPTKLERQVEVLRKNPEFGTVGCGYYLTDDCLAVTGEVLPPPVELADLLLLRANGGLFGSSLIASRKRLEGLGGFDERLSTSADFDLAVRIGQHGQIAVIPEPLVYYRQHGGNMHRGIRLTESDMRRAMGKAFASDLPPQFTRLRRRAYANLYRMLAGSYWHAGQVAPALRCGLQSLANHPGSATALMSGLWRRLGPGRSRTARP